MNPHRNSIHLVFAFMSLLILAPPSQAVSMGTPLSLQQIARQAGSDVVDMVTGDPSLAQELGVPGDFSGVPQYQFDQGFQLHNLSNTNDLKVVQTDAFYIPVCFAEICTALARFSYDAQKQNGFLVSVGERIYGKQVQETLKRAKQRGGKTFQVVRHHPSHMEFIYFPDGTERNSQPVIVPATADQEKRLYQQLRGKIPLPAKAHDAQAIATLNWQQWQQFADLYQLQPPLPATTDASMLTEEEYLARGATKPPIRHKANSGQDELIAEEVASSGKILTLAVDKTPAVQHEERSPKASKRKQANTVATQTNGTVRSRSPAAIVLLILAGMVSTWWICRRLLTNRSMTSANNG